MLSKCKVRKTRYLKGYDTVWDDLGMVRELHINRRVPVRLGPTNAHFDRVREFDNA